MKGDVRNHGLDSLFALDRQSFETKLDILIRDNRFTIAVVFPLIGGLILIASAEEWLPEPLAFNPLLVVFGVLVMRSPLLGGILPLISKRALVFLSLLVGYTYGIEYIGVQTDWPYGAFEYGISLGPMVGGIPVALPILFIPLVLNAYLLLIRVIPPAVNTVVVRLLVTIPLVVLLDVVLDPAAVGLGFWSYADGGFFYDVPLSNYVGWVLSATVAVTLVELSFRTQLLQERIASCPYILDDLVSFVILWGVINLWFGHYIPVIVAIFLGLLLGYTMIYREKSGSITNNLS